MDKSNNSIINSPAPPSIQQTGQSNVNSTGVEFDSRSFQHR